MGEVIDARGGTWAYSNNDVGHPVLARGPWNVWNGIEHVADRSFTCDLEPTGAAPWQTPPGQRTCCCGITGDAASLLGLLLKMAAVLDAGQPHSFGLLHGAWTNGTRLEVDQMHTQVEEAARMFNEERRGVAGCVHAAAVLWRTASLDYWTQCDGIVLYQPGSRA